MRHRHAGKNLLLKRVVTVSVLFGEDVIVGLADQVSPVFDRRGQRHQRLARAGKDVVAILEEDEVVGVVHHGLEVGHHGLVTRAAPQTLGILQQHVDRRRQAILRRRPCVLAANAANPAVGLPQANVEGSAR